MGSSYQQTDTDADCPVGGYCSGSGNISSHTIAKKAVYGGSAGSASNQIAVFLQSKVGVNFEIVPNLSGTWKAGDWTVRLNIVGGHANVTLDEVWICRVSAACGGLSTIGNKTSIGIPLNSVGVKTVVVPGVAVSGASSTDKIIIVCIFHWSVISGGSVSVYISPTELIDTPLDKGGAVSAAGAGAAAFVGRQSWRGALSSAGVGTPALHGKSTKRIVLSAAGGSALSAIGRLLRRGVFSSAGTGGSSLVGTSNKPVLRSDGMGVFSPVGKSTGRMALGATGIGAFVPGSRATVPTSLSIAGNGDTAFIGAATAEATFQIDAASGTDLELTWEGWAQQAPEFPPNAGWVIEGAL